MTLAKDIARSLSTSAARVVDVIPATFFVGLELPNDNRGVFKSKLWQVIVFYIQSPFICRARQRHCRGSHRNGFSKPLMLVAGTQVQVNLLG